MAIKKLSIEYRLLVQHTFDETTKKAGIVFYLETTKQFANFSYEIDVLDVVSENNITWSLRGLRAPSMNLPATGTATFQKVYFGLPKIVRFTLRKNDAVMAETELKFTKTQVTSDRSSNSLVKIYTDENFFESNRINDVVMAVEKPDMRRDPIITKKSNLK